MKLSFRIRLLNSGLLLMGAGLALGHEPVVDAGPDQAYRPRQTMLLQGSATDSDGTIQLYAWTQESGPSISMDKTFDTLMPGSTTSEIWLRTSPLVPGASLLHLKFDQPLSSQGGHVDMQDVSSEFLTCLQVTESSCSATHSVGIYGYVTGYPVTAGSQVLTWFVTGWVYTPVGFTTVRGGFNFDSVTGVISTIEVTAPRPFTPVLGAVAPSVAGTATLTFRLTVTDNQGEVGSDDVVVTVTNAPPTANAGADKSVEAGATVLLPGSGTDEDGHISFYRWNRVSGPTVVLMNRDSATAQFTAPSEPEASILVFQLTTIDSDGAIAVDQVTVNVAAQSKAGGGGGGALDLLMLLALLGLLAGRAAVLRRQG